MEDKEPSFYFFFTGIRQFASAFLFNGRAAVSVIDSDARPPKLVPLPAISKSLTGAEGGVPEVNALSLASASSLCLRIESPAAVAERPGNDGLGGACLPLSIGCGALVFSATMLFGALKDLFRLARR